MYYSEFLDLEFQEIRYYDCEVRYTDMLDIILGTEFCLRYSFRGEVVKLDKLSFYFRKFMHRTKYNVYLHEIEVSNFIRTISLLRNIMRDAENPLLREYIKDLMKIYDDKISIDGGKSYMMLDAFDNDIFMTLLENIELSNISIKFNHANNYTSFEYIKSYILMNKIENLISEDRKYDSLIIRNHNDIRMNISKA